MSDKVIFKQSSTVPGAFYHAECISGHVFNHVDDLDAEAFQRGSCPGKRGHDRCGATLNIQYLTTTALGRPSPAETQEQPPERIWILQRDLRGQVRPLICETRTVPTEHAVGYIRDDLARSAPVAAETELILDRAETTFDAQMLIAVQQLTKARRHAAHTEESGEVCRPDCEGCNDPVGQIVRESQTSHAAPAPDIRGAAEEMFALVMRGRTYFEEQHQRLVNDFVSIVTKYLQAGPKGEEDAEER